MYRTARLVLIAAALLLVGVAGGSAASPTPSPTRQDVAKRILDSAAGQTMTAPARAYMESVARGDQRLAPDSNAVSSSQRSVKVNAAKATGGPGLTNVRVNNPALDTHQTDQTTQSETSVAVSGQNVAVGYNSSQHGLLILTAGGNLTGYGYSTDGGRTFTDGGVLPNAPGQVNVGDPWLASDSNGTMYYSTLSIRPATGDLLVAVSHSTNGGKTWSAAAPIPPPPGQFFYSADKDALTTGPGAGNLYDGWDDFTFDPATGTPFSGLPVAHSTDGGQTWTLTYASKVALLNPAKGCSFSQYIGARPLVAGRILYDGAELISVNDPNCTGAPLTFSEAVFTSRDGGTTWAAGAVIPITSSTPHASQAFQLSTGQLMRNIEFPTLAAFQGKVYVAWNDGGDGSGHSHIRLAQLDESGQATKVSFITSGTNDEVQPALSADSDLHIAYYQISTDASGNGQLDVFVSNSNNGNNNNGNSNNGNGFTSQRVTSQSFPGVFNLPQFDPLIAPVYMGDYIANVSDGDHQYIAWGDNRDIVTNFLWPGGRHDPDVFFARQ
ncbi:MAG TPA: sialidase family protein [Candidatus Dormibacteraeota bacterium]|nr:sialidase family protein [Candidatus Dormibacteraeota bacterium]